MGYFPFVKGFFTQPEVFFIGRILGMTETLVTRLKQAMQERGFNAKSLSEASGINQTGVRDIIKERSKNPRMDTIVKIADALGVRHEWLMSGFGAMYVPEQGNGTYPHFGDTKGVHSTFPFPNGERIPLLGQAHDNQIEWDYHIDEDKAIEWVSPHPSHQGVEGGFALYAVSNRMAPRFYVGDIIYCHPNQPVRIGQDCLIVTQSGASLVGVLKNKDKESYTVSFHNQDGTRTIHKEDVQKILRVVGVLYS